MTVSGKALRSASRVLPSASGKQSRLGRYRRRLAEASESGISTALLLSGAVAAFVAPATRAAGRRPCLDASGKSTAIVARHRAHHRRHHARSRFRHHARHRRRRHAHPNVQAPTSRACCGVRIVAGKGHPPQANPHRRNRSADHQAGDPVVARWAKGVAPSSSTKNSCLGHICGHAGTRIRHGGKPPDARGQPPEHSALRLFLVRERTHRIAGHPARNPPGPPE